MTERGKAGFISDFWGSAALARLKATEFKNNMQDILYAYIHNSSKV